MWAQTIFFLAATGLCVQGFGQTSTDLNPLRQSAEKRTAEWFTVHTALEDSLSRLLPCDARAVKTIEDVNHASDARLEAWIKFTASWRSQTAAESQGAKRAQAELNAQAAVLQAEKNQMESQLTELRTRRAALPPSAEAIQPLDKLIDWNAQRLAAITSRRAALTSALESVAVLVSAAEARAAAVDKEAAQWTEQAERWRAYYAARINRAKTECAITGQAAPAVRAPRKKQ